MAYKKFTASEDMLKPDPRFNSKLVSKFINCLMWQGKKTVAMKCFYGAMDQIAKKSKDKEGAAPPLEVFEDLPQRHAQLFHPHSGRTDPRAGLAQ